MFRLLKHCSTLLCLLTFVTACGTPSTAIKPVCPAAQIIVRTEYAVPPVYLTPACAAATDAELALGTVGSLLQAWLADSTALSSCGAQALTLWWWAAGPANGSLNQPSAAPTPAPAR